MPTRSCGVDKLESGAGLCDFKIAVVRWHGRQSHRNRARRHNSAKRPRAAYALTANDFLALSPLPFSHRSGDGRIVAVSTPRLRAQRQEGTGVSMMLNRLQRPNETGRARHSGRLLRCVGAAVAASVAALLALPAAPGHAADLWDDARDYDREPYEDRRYADIYGDRAQDHRAHRRYDERHDADDRLDDRRIDDHHAEHRERWRRHPRYEHARRCLPRHLIRRRILSNGWHAFTPLRITRDYALVEARDVTGDLYVIEVDRCRGVIQRRDRVRDRYAGYDRRRHRSYD